MWDAILTLNINRMSKTRPGKSKGSTEERRSLKSKDKWKKYSKYTSVFELDDEDEYDNWIPDIKHYR